jgi:hypothetical protein
VNLLSEGRYAVIHGYVSGRKGRRIIRSKCEVTGSRNSGLIIFEKLNRLMDTCFGPGDWIDLNKREKKMDIPSDGKIARYKHLKV